MTTDNKPRLLFNNPVFQGGINATVRLGTKWVEQAPEESIVEVWDTEGGYLFDAFIVMNYSARICDIDEDLLSHEHDPSCRTQSGLVDELRRVYPKKKVTSRDQVTLLLFEQCDPDPGEADDEIAPPRMQ